MIATLNTPIECDNREDWLRQRQSVIGASDTAAIFGVGYADQSPITIWDSKVNPPREDDPAKLKRFRVAKMMEPAMRNIFSLETDLPCDPAGEFTIYRHPELDFIGATLDAQTTAQPFGWMPVELKKVDFGRDEWKEGNVPLKYNVQVQHQMAVTGAPAAYLFGLLGNEPVVRLIERNDRFIKTMIDRLVEFWGYVERREIPPVDSSVATSRLLAKLFPHGNGETVPIEQAWYDDLERAKEDLKDAEARKVAAENQIKAAIGDATFGETPKGDRMSWKEQSRAEHVVKASTFRVLRTCK